MIHELKILPQYFEAVQSGLKTFEIRKNDRDYKVGDTLVLKEYNNEAYTGREIRKDVWRRFTASERVHADMKTHREVYLILPFPIIVLFYNHGRYNTLGIVIHGKFRPYLLFNKLALL